MQDALQRVSQDRLSIAFAVELLHRLREQDPAGTPALLWLDEQLGAQGTNANRIVQEEHSRQGAANVTVRNVITSMRLISALDWQELFESISLVDEALRTNSDFAAMDFPTRDRYRHAIEELARGSKASELEVAKLGSLRLSMHAPNPVALTTLRLRANRIPAITYRRAESLSKRRSVFVPISKLGWCAPSWLQD